MDSDLWISRLAAAKRHLSLQHQQGSHSSDRLNIDDFEVDEESRPDFACPYCYEDHDIASLCSHLEDEHPFESKVAVCPICAVKVTRDMLDHIMVQHGSLFKLHRRRRLHKVAIPSSQALSLLGRDFREAHLQVLMGSEGYRSRSNAVPNTATDSFFSSLVLNFSSSEVEEAPKKPMNDASIKKTATSQPWKTSFDPCMSYEEREQKKKQLAARASFVQDLFLSTLFVDK